jgi:hypothetical protein
MRLNLIGTVEIATATIQWTYLSLVSKSYVRHRRWQKPRRGLSYSRRMTNTLFSDFYRGRLSHVEVAGVGERSRNTLSSGKDIQTRRIPGLMKTIYIKILLLPTIASSALYYMKVAVTLGRDQIRML